MRKVICQLLILGAMVGRFAGAAETAAVTTGAEGVEYGLAAKYPNDAGLKTGFHCTRHK